MGGSNSTETCALPQTRTKCHEPWALWVTVHGPLFRASVSRPSHDGVRQACLLQPDLGP